MIITLDQEKAFYRVDRVCLFKTLNIFGYGPKLIAKIIIYNDIEAQFQVNGRLSQNVSVERGMCHWCPLSMIFCVILVEVFLQNLKNEILKG